MMGWINTRTKREKMLLLAAVAALLAGMVWQFLVKPSFLSLEKARAEYQQANQTLARLDQIELLTRTGQKVSAPTQSNSISAAELKSRLKVFAEQSGVKVSELPSSDTNLLIFKIDGLNGPNFFRWIERAETQLPLSVTRASFSQNEDLGIDGEIAFVSKLQK